MWLRIRKYLCNSCLKREPGYSLIKDIKFYYSRVCKSIQLADVVANTVLRTKAGTGGNGAYREIASRTKYIEFTYPRN